MNNSCRENGPHRALVTIIVPVYSGYEQTLRCLDSVARAQRVAACSPVRLVVVNDASPDRELVAQLRERAEAGDFQLLEHSSNLGFPAAINSGLSVVREGHALLLNADTAVAPGWLEKMLAAAASRPDVATVTPFSNNASICTVPLAGDCQNDPLLSVERLDAAAARANPGVYLELPTGIGFCLLVTRQCLDRIGGFAADVFGRGYGEETDFCRRAVKAGMVNLLACDTFVYHQGRVSFGFGEGASRQLLAEQVIHRRHPDYPGAVARWVRLDPAGPARIALRLALMRESSVPLLLQVTHGLGGGVERHVQELASVVHGRAWALVLRPGRRVDEVCLSLGGGKPVDRLYFRLPDDASLLQELLLGVGLARIHVHHVHGLPERLWGLLDELACPIDLTLHDYSIINGSPTLTNAAGRYVGERQGGDYEFANAERAERLQVLAASAQRCLVPCEDMRQRLQRGLPWLSTEVRAHPERECRGPYPAPRVPLVEAARPLRVLCLGALGREKGVEVLRNVANAAARQGLPLEFSLLGSAHIPLGRHVRQLGAYDDEQLQALLSEHRPQLVWYPVQWPETWSYTLSAALEAGLPVLASDVGAFTERLHGRPLSWLRPHTASTEEWLACLLDIRNRLIAAQGRRAESGVWPQEEVSPFYTQAYVPEQPAPSILPALPPAHRWGGRHASLFVAESGAGWRARLLAWALRAREWRWLGGLIALVPYNGQRRVKRFL